MPSDRELLAHDEEILVDTRLHWAPLVAPALLVVAAIAAAVTLWVELPSAPVAAMWLLVAMVALPVLWLVGRLVRWRSVRLLVTDGRLVYRRGVLRRDVAQLRLQRVAEVHCTQTLWGRLVGCGQLVLEIAGGDAMVLDNVRRPRSLQRVIAGELDDAWSPRPVPAGPSVGWAARPSDAGPETPPRGMPAIAVPGRVGVPGGTGSSSVPDQLIRLDELRQRGILTEEEFQAKKAELLSRL